MKSALLLLAATALAQSPAPATSTLPTFEVASVRVSGPNIPQRTNVPLDNGNVYGTLSPDDARTAAGGYFIATHQPLWRFISFAYQLSGTQEMALRFSIFSGIPKSGAPFWVTGSFDAPPEYFDISARASADTSIDQMRLMMRSLLADRFHLVTHTTTASAPVFALRLVHPGILGPHLHPHSASDTCAAVIASDSSLPPPTTALSSIGSLPPACGVIANVPSAEPGQHYGGRAIPMSLFATSVPTMTGLAATPRPVVDQTGLGGLCDFTLHWIHDRAATDSAVSDNIASFHEALKSQLGLELKPTRAPIELLIIDHIDHPTEN